MNTSSRARSRPAQRRRHREIRKGRPLSSRPCCVGSFALDRQSMQTGILAIGPWDATAFSGDQGGTLRPAAEAKPQEETGEHPGFDRRRRRPASALTASR